MKRASTVVICIAIIASAVVVAVASTASLSASKPSYEWILADPNNGQLAAYETATGVLTVASVRTTNGCPTAFLVPERKPFLYDLKIRTATGPILCTQIVRDELIAFYEASKTGVVQIKTASGTVTSVVQKPSTGAPSP